jgi:hypothetical protein
VCRDADEAEVEPDVFDGHILPYGPDGQPVPQVQLAYALGKATEAFRLILGDCSIEECKQVWVDGWVGHMQGLYASTARSREASRDKNMLLHICEHGSMTW